MKLIHVVGARPNFMKAAPVISALAKCDEIQQKIVHTGQHYNKNMSEVFFEELGIPPPDVNLEVGSGSHAVMTAQIMMRFEQVVAREKPEMILVYGDVNSTVAAALVATKMGVKVAHIEAGLRSRDRSMPEELNRLVTDQLSDHLFTPSADADENLRQENILPDKIHLVGNLMIDTLVRLLSQAKRPVIDGLGDSFCLVTLHRPSNVDEPRMLQQIVAALAALSREIDVVFPIHPRTRERLKQSGAGETGAKLKLIEPLGYLHFLALQRDARFVITDSGGIQEETTYLGVPCLTVRENTERPITVTLGTNILVGHDLALLQAEASRIIQGGGKKGQVPPLWDGHAGGRVADIICALA